MGYVFTTALLMTVSSIHRQKRLGICLPTVGSQTWVRSGWEFFRPSGESNPHPWRWIKPARDQHVKCNERLTRPCHRAYYIRGSTPFHSCVEVVRGSPVTETCVKPLPRGQGPIHYLLLYRGSSPFTHCATSAGHCATSAGNCANSAGNWTTSAGNCATSAGHCATSAGTLRHQCHELYCTLSGRNFQAKQHLYAIFSSWTHGLIN